MKSCLVFCFLACTAVVAFSENLRMVDGKLYNADRSELWGAFNGSILQTNDEGAFIEWERYVMPDGTTVKGKGHICSGKVLSVTDEGCLVSGTLFSLSNAGRENEVRDTVFFVSPLKGYVDGDSISEQATVYEGTYKYLAAGGAAKTVRRFTSIAKGKKKIFIRNLHLPAGTSMHLRCMQNKAGEIDCGVPYGNLGRVTMATNTPVIKK